MLLCTFAKSMNNLRVQSAMRVERQRQREKDNNTTYRNHSRFMYRKKNEPLFSFGCREFFDEKKNRLKWKCLCVSECAQNKIHRIDGLNILYMKKVCICIYWHVIYVRAIDLRFALIHFPFNTHFLNLLMLLRISHSQSRSFTSTIYPYSLGFHFNSFSVRMFAICTYRYITNKFSSFSCFSSSSSFSSLFSFQSLFALQIHCASVCDEVR